MAPQGQRGAPLPRPDDAVEAQYRDGRRRIAKPLDRQEFQKLARVHHPRNMGIVPPPDQKRRRREAPPPPTPPPPSGGGGAPRPPPQIGTKKRRTPGNTRPQ